MQEIVALSGAHTLGRARPDRSGWGKPETKYTVCFVVPLLQFIRNTGLLSVLLGSFQACSILMPSITLHFEYRMHGIAIICRILTIPQPFVSLLY